MCTHNHDEEPQCAETLDTPEKGVVMHVAAMQVRANARALGARLMRHGYKLVTDGTDNHLVLWDLRKEVSTRHADARTAPSPLNVSSLPASYCFSIILLSCSCSAVQHPAASAGSVGVTVCQHHSSRVACRQCWLPMLP